MLSINPDVTPINAAAQPETKDTTTSKNPIAIARFDTGIATMFVTSETSDTFLNIIAVMGKVPICAARVPIIKINNA